MKYNITSVTFLITAIIGMQSNVFAQVNADYSAVPITSEEYDPPQIMLSMSRDHQYFFKAYNDYTDLDPDNLADVDADGNPLVETTYKHSFDYFGYFDFTKCYLYSGGRFQPQSISTDKYCSGSNWSGNFLNWVSMSRMDIVRSIFYGGSRSTDTGADTVLERAFLPSDAHSYAKYYNGDDLSQLTPFNTTRTDGTNGGDSDGFDDMNEGITFCNTSFDSSGTVSQSSTELPKIRSAEGNYQLWGANERWQCTWDNEKGNNGNSNTPPSAPITISVGGIDIDVDSGIDAHTGDPSPGNEYIARVNVCVSDALVGEENCKQYPDGNLKPIGILQTYGDRGLINFGLMTGSYASNIQGGVLRKNMSAFSDEVDVNGNGRFLLTANNAGDSIVRTLESLRPWGYRFDNGTYFGGTGTDNCPFQLTNISNGNCKSWGNPISEIYKETIRYLAGLTATNTYNVDDSPYIAGLGRATWNNPLDTDTQCAGLNTIVINASVSSYDDDDTGIAGVPGGINKQSITTAIDSTTDTWTDSVGTVEGIHTGEIVDPVSGAVTPSTGIGTFFIGRSGTDTNEFCDAKTIPLLSEAFGLCPEAPTVSGSFAMAGIAYYAHNNDIRSDLDGNQTVNTFAISLATNTPNIVVPLSTGGTAVTLLPAYRLLRTPDEGGGALVDFKIVQPHTPTGVAGIYSAKYYVNWEDSEQGGDYDQDMWGTIEYIFNENTEKITVVTTAFAESTGQPQLFGFVISGTGATDGFHAYSGIEGADHPSVNGVPGCNNCRPINGGGGSTGQFGPQSHTFDVVTTLAGQSLESPLYYAAKYGGFSEEDDVDGIDALDASPDKVSEWDAIDNLTGDLTPDGLPDNYFFVINPENLFDSLNNALQKILSDRPGSASATANLANADGFSNMVTQALYQESLVDENNDEVAWTGDVLSYFIDNFGIFREDTDGDGVLDDYPVDKAFYFENDDNGTADDPSDDLVQIVRQTASYNLVDGVSLLELGADGFPVLTDDATKVLPSELDTLWSAQENLRSLDNDSIKIQRTYSDAVNQLDEQEARYIFTYIDEDLDGVVDSGEQQDFVEGLIDADNAGHFGTTSQSEAQRIVNFIRGHEDNNNPQRNRTLEEGSDTYVYRLGDIVNSTPRIVGAPTQAYDTIYGDETYAEFRELYENRRHMVYVGANDGLLHAFNAGFRNQTNGGIEFQENLTGIETTPPTVANHNLGAEIWAYAPNNLLPHLQWLTSGFYTHVYYVDGAPDIFEAKIFADDTTHPKGWGTILVVGMELGGGDFPITTSEGSSTTRSAYIVLDITDPEIAPTVLAEVSHPDMNLTTGSPTLYYECTSTCANTSQNDNFDGEWKLVFGSGPNSIQNNNTNETAKIFTYDLETKVLEMHEVEDSNGDTLDNSYVGAFASRDWDNGETGSRDDDVVYFGTIGEESTGTKTGGVYRFRPKDGNATSTLIDTDRPVSGRPLTLANELIDNFVLGSWVYFGTGIFSSLEDEATSAQEQYFGVREPLDTTTLAGLSTAAFDPTRQNSALLEYTEVDISDLFDVTDIEVINDDDDALGAAFETGDLRTSAATAADGSDVDTFTELKDYIVAEQQGWYRDLPLGANTGEPSSRVFTDTAFLKTQLFFTTFQPSAEDTENICIGGFGNSELFALNTSTGTASDFAALGVLASGTAANSVGLGIGTAATPVVFTSESIGGNKAKIITQKSNTETTNETVNTSTTQFNRSGWREIIN